MLAVVYALEENHQYTYGSTVIVNSDHQPLEMIIKKPKNCAARRLQNMLLRMLKYDAELKCREGKEMFISDMLSQSYLENEPNDQAEMKQVNMAKFLPIREERLKQICEATEQDETLQLLEQEILQGWAESKTEDHTLDTLLQYAG